MKFEYATEDRRMVSFLRFPFGETPPPYVIDAETGWVLNRVFHPTGVAFKCGGFYSTDKGDSIAKWQREHMTRD